MTERKPPGVPYERWVDRQVRTAAERGAFEGLPGAGKPLEGLEGPRSAYDWVAQWARREDIVTGAVLPPSLALRKEREELLESLPSRRTEPEVRALVAEFNTRLRRALLRPQEGPPLTLTLLDADEVVRRWADVREPAPPPPDPVGALSPGPTRWWRRARGPGSRGGARGKP